jgi:hypothetical protein
LGGIVGEGFGGAGFGFSSSSGSERSALLNLWPLGGIFGEGFGGAGFGFFLSERFALLNLWPLGGIVGEGFGGAGFGFFWSERFTLFPVCVTTTQFPSPAAVTNDARQRFLLVPPLHLMPSGSLTDSCCVPLFAGF